MLAIVSLASAILSPLGPVVSAGRTITTIISYLVSICRSYCTCFRQPRRFVLPPMTTMCKLLSHCNKNYTGLQAGVGHYGVFSGNRWTNQIYPMLDF